MPNCRTPLGVGASLSLCKRDVKRGAHAEQRKNRPARGTLMATDNANERGEEREEKGKRKRRER